MAVAEKVPVPKTPRLRDRHLFPDALLNAELPLEKKEPVPLKRETRHEHDRIDMRAKPVAEPDPIELDAEDFESWIASQCQREFELIPQCDRFLSNRAEFEFVEIDIVDHVGGKKNVLAVERPTHRIPDVESNRQARQKIRWAIIGGISADNGFAAKGQAWIFPFEVIYARDFCTIDNRVCVIRQIAAVAQLHARRESPAFTR